MNWLKSIFYGLLCGLSEYLPISLLGHQSLFAGLFGAQIRNPVSDLLIHLSLLVVVVLTNYSFVMRIRRELKVSVQRSRRDRIAHSARYDSQLIKAASLPLIIMLFLRPLVFDVFDNSLFLAFGFLLNGIVLHLPSRLMKGNKNARSMSAADAFLIGAAGGLSVFPGISGIGASLSVAAMRGADCNDALNWGLILCIPALIVQCIIDVFSIPGANFVTYAFGHYLLIILGTVAGGYLSVLMIRALSSRNGISGFAFYSWGAALLSLILFMIV